MLMLTFRPETLTLWQRILDLSTSYGCIVVGVVFTVGFAILEPEGGIASLTSIFICSAEILCQALN